MGKKDPRVDAYIEKSADFAKPILKHLRKVVHAAVPDVEETTKWRVPHFDYNGEMMCSMAAFKTHCAFGFWKGSLVLGDKAKRDAAGHLGRLASMEDLPSDKTLTGYIKQAAKLNEKGVKVARVMRAKSELAVPGDFMAALRKNKKALVTFETFSPSHKREYVEWIIEAKADATRERRMAAALEWLAAGKARNWKYMAR